MKPTTPTEEWPSLIKVWEKKKEIVHDRWAEHKQHPVEHGAPRVRPDVYLAAMVMCKANRIWSNLQHGGTSRALMDSCLDLSNYCDFLAAHLEDTGGQDRFPIIPEPVIRSIGGGK